MIGLPSAVIFTAEDVSNGIPAREMDVAGRRGIAENERWHLRKDGSRFWGSGLVTPLLDEGGELRGFVKVVRDMTDRKQAEEALRDADRRKDEFLAMLAHELRNPLSSIQNAAQLVRHAALPPAKADWAKGVILDQVRPPRPARRRPARRGADHPRQDPPPAGERRPGAGPGRRRRGGPADGRSAPATSSPSTCRPARSTSRGDATRLEQVFVNLLTNAAKYTDPGGRIELSARRDGDSWVVRVVDTGVGISAEMMSRVFDLFAQVDSSLDRSQGGLGIGLTISQSLVQLHGGTIAVASEGPGRGSTFTVRLPALEAAPEVIAPACGPPAAHARAGARVLVVDDNRATARALTDLLRLSGFTVLAAHDGLDAIAAARQHCPEVVLLDIGLPGMDGYQVARQLRNEEAARDARIIAVTGYSEDQARRRSREAGFDHHLVKPVDYDALLDLIGATGHGGTTPAD